MVIENQGAIAGAKERVQLRERRCEAASIDDRSLALWYLDAKDQVINRGFACEIDWQEERHFDYLTESEFLQEVAWVIVNSGFRESVARTIFPLISTAFLNWADATSISSKLTNCRQRALKVFGHRGKVEAICEVVRQVAQKGFEPIKADIGRNGISVLRQFPYIGPITACHLAKNIGLHMAKPDRHLCRVANAFGESSVQSLCRRISFLVAERIDVVDVVIWRHSTLVHTI